MIICCYGNRVFKQGLNDPRVREKKEVLLKRKFVFKYNPFKLSRYINFIQLLNEPYISSKVLGPKQFRETQNP